jgi:hypothetical protein
MTMSLNEVEAMARKAARGAGFEWGLAEDAGKATRWLCAHGQDGVAVAVAVFTNGAAAESTLACGAALSDRAADLRDGSIELQNLADPLFLMPFAAMAAQTLRATVEVECDGCRALTDGKSLTLIGDFPEIASALSIRLTDTVLGAEGPSSRARPNPSDWAELETLAKRTYAPATDESRLKGAGAGLSDND